MLLGDKYLCFNKSKNYFKFDQLPQISIFLYLWTPFNHFFIQQTLFFILFMVPIQLFLLLFNRYLWIPLLHARDCIRFYSYNHKWSFPLGSLGSCEIFIHIFIYLTVYLLCAQMFRWWNYIAGVQRKSKNKKNKGPKEVVSMARAISEGDVAPNGVKRCANARLCTAPPGTACNMNECTLMHTYKHVTHTWWANLPIRLQTPH